MKAELGAAEVTLMENNNIDRSVSIAGIVTS
jgi:hypothetical protein